MTEKYIKDGMVAVLYSPGFGAGWTTWSHDADERLALLFDPVIVDFILNGDPDNNDKILNYLTIKYPDFYTGGLDGLTIKWLPKGTEFRVDEYDGSESIEVKDQIEWIRA